MNFYTFRFFVSSRTKWNLFGLPTGQRAIVRTGLNKLSTNNSTLDSSQSLFDISYNLEGVTMSNDNEGYNERLVDNG